MTFSTDSMPRGYTLIRYGWCKWGWRAEADSFSFQYTSEDTFWTAGGARNNAIAHKEEMAALEMDDHNKRE